MHRAGLVPACVPSIPIVHKYSGSSRRAMLPRVALRAAVESALAGQGRTVRQVEADEAGGRVREGDAEQEEHRGRPVWHTKKEIDEEVVRILRLDPSLCGPRRKSDELPTAVAKELIRLRKSGRLVDWNAGHRYSTYRLADGGGEEPPPSLGAGLGDLAMTSDERPSASAPAGGSMWDSLVAILRHGPFDNTYKFALARALIELCGEDRGRRGDALVIPYRGLAEKFLRYYWHQEYRFHMRQDFHTKKRPRVISALRRVWGDGPQPGSFASLDPGDRDRAVRLILSGVFGHARSKTSFVVPRFQNVRSGAGTAETRAFYDYDDDAQEIVMRPGAPEFFRDNRVMAESLVTLEWTRYLERANRGLPSLVAKVERIDEPERGQAQLARYRRAWSRRTCHCFYCRCRLERGLVHVDHFIPWSYIFDDSEWNLVLACRACNLKKGASLPQGEFRDALVRRNRKHERDMGGLRQSLVLLDRGSGWEREIKGHYDMCLEYGFGTVAMP